MVRARIVKMSGDTTTQTPEDPEAAPTLLGADGWKAITWLVQVLARGAVFPMDRYDYERQYDPNKCSFSEAQEMYLGCVDAMGAWAQLLGYGRLENMCGDDAVGKKYDHARGVLARLATVWLETYWSVSPTPPEMSKYSPAMQKVIEGIREAIVYEVHALDDMLPGYEVDNGPRVLAPALAVELAEVMGYPEVAGQLATLRSDNLRQRAFAAHFSFPRYLDRLCSETASGHPVTTTSVKDAQPRVFRLGIAVDPAKQWELSLDFKKIKRSDGTAEFRISQAGCQEALRFLTSKQAFDDPRSVTKKELCEAVWTSLGKPEGKRPKEFKPVQFFRHSKDKQTVVMPFYDDVIGKDEGHGRYFLRMLPNV